MLVSALDIARKGRLRALARADEAMSDKDDPQRRSKTNPYAKVLIQYRGSSKQERESTMSLAEIR